LAAPMIMKSGSLLGIEKSVELVIAVGRYQ